MEDIEGLPTDGLGNFLFPPTDPMPPPVLHSSAASGAAHRVAVSARCGRDCAAASAVATASDVDVALPSTRRVGVNVVECLDEPGSSTTLALSFSPCGYYLVSRSVCEVLWVMMPTRVGVGGWAVGRRCSEFGGGDVLGGRHDHDDVVVLVVVLDDGDREEIPNMFHPSQACESRLPHARAGQPANGRM